MHWRGVKLPSRRVQVYQIATDTLIEYWTAQREVVELDAEEIKAILSPVAYQILSSGVSGVIGESDLLPRFFDGIIEQRGCNPAEAKQIGRGLLHNLNEQSGIFLERGLDHNSQPVYGFLHQTFGEYLAALHLAQKMLKGEFQLAEYIHRSGWHEPILLMAGHLSIISPTHANKLIRTILDFDTPYEEMLKRNLLLAVDCLADDVQAEHSLRKEILQELALLLQHEAPQVREAALADYHQLAVTRHRDAAINALRAAYPLDNGAELQKLSGETRLNIVTALVYLGQHETARPIVWQLDEKPDGASQYTVKRLRFEHWSGQAADYIINLQADKNYNFSVSSGQTLTDCTIGPVNGALARKVLKEEGLCILLDTLIERIKDKDERVIMQWMRSITPSTPSDDSILPFTKQQIPMRIRRLAATRLLDSPFRSEAVNILQSIAENEADESVAAAQALLDAGEADYMNWDLIIDTALLSNHEDAPMAIDALWRGGYEIFALSATLHLLACCQSISYHDRDQRIKDSVDALLEYGEKTLGLATLQWLSLRPGYQYRLEACEGLIEAGRIQQAVPLLQVLAYECHDISSQRACEHLLKYQEADRVFSLLASMSQRDDPVLRHHACLAMALIGDQAMHPTVTLDQERSRLKQSVTQYRQQMYVEALNNFLQTASDILKLKSAPNTIDTSLQCLGHVSLMWLAATMGFTHKNENNLSDELNKLSDCVLPVIRLNAALFYLRCGDLKIAQQLLVGLLTDVSQSLSSTVEQEVVFTIGKFAIRENIFLMSQFLSKIDRAVRRRAASALGSLGYNDALQPLVNALNDDDSSVRRSAVGALGALGDDDALQPLVNALNDDDSSVRGAASALGSLRHDDALQPLVNALNDGDNNVRRNAASALGSLRHDDALQPLVNALNDEDRGVRWSAASALGSLRHNDALQPLVNALNDDDRSVRGSAADALGRLGHNDAIQPLVNALNDEDSGVRWRAAEALGSLGHNDALQPLVNALNGQSSIVRESAADALGRLGHNDAIQPLVNALNDGDSSVRESAASALGNLRHEDALQPLVNALNDEDSGVRRSAANALGSLRHDDALQPLVNALNDGDSGVRWSAADALSRLGHNDALQPLVNALSDEDGSIRWNAAFALGRLGHEDALQPLVNALNDEDSGVRWGAASALGRLGHDDALQPLVHALSDGDRNVRSSAAEALGRLGNNDALQPLVHALSDEDRNVRSNAASALGRLHAKEYANLITTLSSSTESYSARTFAKSLIHLDPISALQVINRYSQKFQWANWSDLRGQAFVYAIK
ncbi:MAG: HEAT repeat domain-containing protein [Caldilineaceae bacterium]